MSIECAICEHDARSGHADDCPRNKKRATAPKDTRAPLVKSPPISATAALRKLERAYARQGEELDAARKQIDELGVQISILESKLEMEHEK